jgi:hypothetical protein
MEIKIIKTTENPDGSADCLLRFDEEGLGFLVQEGVLAILRQYIDQCEKEAKRKAKNESRETKRTNDAR